VGLYSRQTVSSSCRYFSSRAGRA